MLRIILNNKDVSGNFHWYLITYFEDMDYDDTNSAYNFSWLSIIQIKALYYMLEFLSEEYGERVAVAQEILSDLIK